ncbi:hypothetical protein BDQ17DRAFT_1549476 [Cyathus striatus]|nr:hypothetical protein BDQ17DRAFT_1441516 [Cyathus striatus]KAF8981532.1 hypothetical protein BDQ17DRAFT_1549476 [Cyathus striatus]
MHGLRPRIHRWLAIQLSRRFFQQIKPENNLLDDNIKFDFEIIEGLGTIEDDVVNGNKRRLGKDWIGHLPSLFSDTSLTLATATQLPIPPCNALSPTLSPLPGEGETPSEANMARLHALISTPCQRLPPSLCYPPVDELFPPPP